MRMAPSVVVYNRSAGRQQQQQQHPGSIKDPARQPTATKGRMGIRLQSSADGRPELTVECKGSPMIRLACLLACWAEDIAEAKVAQQKQLWLLLTLHPTTTSILIAASTDAAVGACPLLPLLLLLLLLLLRRRRRRLLLQRRLAARPRLLQVCAGPGSSHEVEMMTKGRSAEYSRLMKSARLSLARRPKSCSPWSATPAAAAAGCAAVSVSVMPPPS
jgi:uncharacterized protein (TIGR03382 family)